MAMSERPRITDEQLQGFKYFQKFLPQLDQLHAHGTARDRARNRVLHYDQYIALQLLFFFNPVVTSMRGLVQASTLQKAQRELGVAATSLGSFSEAGGVFDAELFKPLIADLAGQLKPLKHDARLDDLPGILTAVDGTELSALARLASQLITGRNVKLHTHFEVLTGVPVDMDLTAAKADERAHLRARVLPGRVYVTDRGYACFELFETIRERDSWLVCRLRDNSDYELVEARALTSEARAAGILSDQLVWLGSPGRRQDLTQPLRVLKLACPPHHKRGGRGPEQGEYLLLATNLVDLPAEVVALIYRQRWAVELFFRFFKYILGCRHLLSHRPNGIQIQVYLAMIVCLLIALWTGRKPTLRTVEMIRFYFQGWASLDELQTHLAKLQKLEA